MKSETQPPNTGEDATGMERRVWESLSNVEDPELPISIVDLGLIYGVEVTDARATIEMTLTATGCPAQSMLRENAREAVTSVEGVDGCEVRLVWQPTWSTAFITEAGKKQLHEFGVSVP